MPNALDLITPENLSKELLYDLFESVFMDVSYDKDGDLLVHEDVRCFVFPDNDSKDKIRLVTMFGFNPSVGEVDRLRSVNFINEKYIIARAYSTQNDTLSFDYEILIKGGITKKNLVLSVKRFCTIPRLAVREFAQGLVE
jgi:hypothetical protein